MTREWKFFIQDIHDAMQYIKKELPAIETAIAKILSDLNLAEKKRT